MITNFNIDKMIKFTSFTSLMVLISCGSAEFVPTKDICSIVKHYKDNVFQVQINDEPINRHYYLYDDAVAITKDLAKKNKCMK